MPYLDDVKTIWEMVKESFRPQMIDSAIELWFGEIEVISFENNVLTLGTSSELKFDIITKKYLGDIKHGFSQYLGSETKVDLIFTGKDNKIFNPIVNELLNNNNSNNEEENSVPQRINNKVATTRIGSTMPVFNFEYTFDNFIVGNSNKFAHAACVAVSEKPAADYNPLFIYGPSGLGKTHLMYAIINELAKKKPNIKIIYIKGEDFTNQFIDSLSKQATKEFRDKYRSCDVLLIDDIQFIAGKVATQEEFFHTFNALYDDNKQIILTSDRPPKDIKILEDRLKTRFEWGLIADIQPPDLELRVAIIKKKAEQVNVNIPDEVLNFLAENLRSNIRQIEGAIKKLGALSFLEGRNVSMELARSCISELLGGAEPVNVTLDKIFNAICQKYDVKKADLTGPRRTKELALVRHITIYLIRNITDMSLPNIGKIFNRDHSTVLSSISMIEGKVNTDSMFALEINELTKQIQGE